ncbi:hypothetical protein [Erythrobacter crassostreae]|uniref:Uncharacterized protein n=1 Tax=Erythrobacter crassostreae TaxID=2828328 RepID=A0A9X1JN27_9SPHN|nr:hypothetical protein [Erythrobacter crassostrea]MBV7258052.1 hypothetical protein [Erythrobacter crassostrea]
MNSDSVNGLQKLGIKLEDSLDAMLAQIMAVDEDVFHETIRQLLESEIKALGEMPEYHDLDDSLATASAKLTFEKRMAEIKHGTEVSIYSAKAAFHNAKLAWELARKTYTDEQASMQADLDYSDRMTTVSYKENFDEDSRAGIRALVAQLRIDHISGRSTQAAGTASAHAALGSQAGDLIDAYRTLLDVTREIELSRMENEATAFRDYWQSVEVALDG